MLRLTLLLVVAIVASGCGDNNEDDQGSEPETRLEISVWRAGTDGPVRTTIVECPDAPAPGSTNEACVKLAQLDDPFAPVPEDTVCTLVYGGPQVAEVHGRFRPADATQAVRNVGARFNRTNSCEIERWDRVAFLFPTR